jgi:hypothetical protein
MFLGEKVDSEESLEEEDFGLRVEDDSEWSLEEGGVDFGLELISSLRIEDSVYSLEEGGVDFGLVLLNSLRIDGSVHSLDSLEEVGVDFGLEVLNSLRDGAVFRLDWTLILGDVAFSSDESFLFLPMGNGD